MKLNLTHFLSVILLLLVSGLSAQGTPSIYIQDQSANPGEVIELDVQVTEFIDIISTAFTINWDSMSLRYVGIENIALDLSEDDNFNATEASGGKLTFLYFDNSLSGNSLLDDETLFTLKLEVLGGMGEQTTVSFGGLLEVVDISEMDLQANFDGALVTMGSVSAAAAVVAENFMATVSPNPFNKDAQVQLTLSEGGTVAWSLLELNGQQVAQGQANLGSGEQSLTLENTLFKHTGTYLLKLQLENTVITRRLMYVVP
jgi:hypothetical protein